MFLKKQLRGVKSKTLSASADFINEKFDGLLTESCCGMTLQKGGLCASQKVTVDVASSANAGFEFAEGLCLSAPGGIFFRDNNGTTHNPVKSVFSVPAFLFCPKQGAVVVSQRGRGTFFFLVGSPDTSVKISDVGFETLTFAKERLFGVCGNILYYSARSDFSQPLAQIKLPQECCGVAKWKGDVFALGNEVYRISFNDNERDTKVTTVFQNAGNIIAKTVAVIGNTLLFLADSKLFCYSQNKLQQIAHRVSFGENQTSATAAVAQNVYYLSYAEAGQARCSAVLAIDANTLETVCKYRLSANNLWGGKRLLFAQNDRLRTFGSGFCNGFWKSKQVDFSSVGKKHFKKLTVRTKFPVDVHLVSDSQRQVFHFFGNDCAQTLKINGVFRNFAVEVYSEGEAELALLQVIAQEYGNKEAEIWQIN